MATTQTTNTNSNKSKVTLCFMVPITSAADSKEVKSAYSKLRAEIIQFANAITRDPNAIIAHTVVSEDPKDLKPIMIGTKADGKMAELQSVGKHWKESKRAKEEIPTPKEEDDNDPPRVVVHSDYVLPPKVTAVPVTAAPKEVAKPVPVAVDADAIIEEIFKDLKRTEKSDAIITYLAKNANKEVTKADIIKGSKYDDKAVGNWIAVAGKEIKAFTTVRRGVYLFDSSKV